jgi:hypothetical protein
MGKAGSDDVSLPAPERGDHFGLFVYNLDAKIYFQVIGKGFCQLVLKSCWPMGTFIIAGGVVAGYQYQFTTGLKCFQVILRQWPITACVDRKHHKQHQSVSGKMPFSHTYSQLNRLTVLVPRSASETAPVLNYRLSSGEIPIDRSWRFDSARSIDTHYDFINTHIHCLSSWLPFLRDNAITPQTNQPVEL